MNREIKFRGWTLQMYKVEGLLSKKGVDYYISNLRQMPLAYLVRPETIGQYTGLKDKNGVEIFEGDVIIAFDSNYIVQFDNGSFCLYSTRYKNHRWGNLYSLFEHNEPFEIIGNIHENKELL